MGIYTRTRMSTYEHRDLPIEKIWQLVKDQLKFDMPGTTYFNYIKDTFPLSYHDGCFHVVCKRGAHEWLKVRMTRTIERLLVGACNNPDVKVKFISEGGKEP